MSAESVCIGHKRPPSKGYQRKKPVPAKLRLLLVKKTLSRRLLLKRAIGKRLPVKKTFSETLPMKKTISEFSITSGGKNNYQ